MDTLGTLLETRELRDARQKFAITAAGLLLATASLWITHGGAGAAALGPTTTLSSPLTASPHASVRAVRPQSGPRVAASKVAKKPMAAPKRIPPPKPGRITAPEPTCGVRGRPPCSTGPKSPKITTPAPSPCGTSAAKPCPPPPSSGLPLIVTPPPPSVHYPGAPGGRFGATYLDSLPRFSERAPAGSPATAFPKQLLVLLNQTQPAVVEDDLARQYRLQRVSGQTLTLLAARAQLYAIPDRRSVAAVVSALAVDPRVRLAQANFRYRRQGEAGKALAGELQYGLIKMAIAPAHNLAQGRGVQVAVIDTAIDTQHPDLSGAVLRSFDAMDGTPGGGDGHGTAVAGIICAQGAAVWGVAPMARILAVRAFAATEKRQSVTSSSAVLLRAIEWSMVNGAHVINMSFVGPRDPALEAMIDASQKRNAVVVAAAGNGGPKAPPAYPAAYPDVVAVTAVDATDRRYVHANRGKYIAISASGVDILAPADGGKHTFLSGTSFAAAHISGIAALLLERNRDAGSHGVLAALTENAVDLGPAGWDEDFGFGRADAFAALQAITKDK